MSTRSLTTVRSRWATDDPWTSNAVIYRHHDGYLEGHGQWVFGFLKGLTVVNGIGSKTPKRYANGAGRLAAQLVARLQEDKHDPELFGVVTECGQEYLYQIDVDEDLTIRVTVFDGPMTAFGMGGEECIHKAFTGTVASYGRYLRKQQAAA